MLMLLAYPASTHSEAAITSLRNVPAHWLPSSLPLKREFLRFIDRFGVGDVIFITWPGAKIGDPELDAVTEALETLTRDPTNHDADGVRMVRDIGGTDRPFEWVESGSAIRRELMGPPLGFSSRSAKARLRGTIIGDDDQTCVIASLTEAVGHRHRQMFPAIRRLVAQIVDIDPDDVVMVGGPVDGAAVDDESIRSIQRFALPSSIIAAVICLVCLRSFVLSAVVIGVATIGQGMVLAGLYYADVEISAILIVLPPLIFVLTVSSGIHLSNYYLDLVGEAFSESDPSQTHLPAETRATLAARAIRIGVPPCLIATFTTVVGLSSLSIVRLQPVRVFGVAASLAMLATLMMLILMLPGAMTLCRRRPRRTRSVDPTAGNAPAKGIVPAIGNGRANGDGPSARRGWLNRGPMVPAIIMAVFLVVTVAAASGLPGLRTTVRVTGMFDADSELRRSYASFEREIGATLTGDILIRFDQDGRLDDPIEDAISEYRSVMAAHAAVRKVDGVGGVLSAVTFLPLPPRAGAGSIAAVTMRQSIASEILSDDSSVRNLGYLDTDADDRTWRLSVRLFQNGDREFGEIIDAIESAVDDSLRESVDPSRVRPIVVVTGHVVIVQRSQELLLNDLFTSFFVALAIIAVMMTLFLRSFVGGLLSMVPNVVPTLVLFGTMGLMGTPLDIGSVMTASVALGIAVDDTVHLLSRFRAMVARGETTTTQSRAAAATAALSSCGWAMLQTTVVCSLALAAYTFSPFIPTRRFAFFMFGLLALAYVGVATLLPAIMVSPAGQFLCKSLRNPGATNDRTHFGNAPARLPSS